MSRNKSSGRWRRGVGGNAVLGFLSITAASLFAPRILMSQDVPQDSVTAFARVALDDYVTHVVTPENASRLGFNTREEARGASLGDPLPVSFIGLADLKRFTADTPVESLVREGFSVWYPVISGGEPRAQLEILTSEGKLVAGEFGRPVTARTIGDVQSRLPGLLRENDITPPYTVSLLRIPALAASFIHAQSSDGRFLVPAMVAPQRYNVENGEVYQADELLQRLREVAATIDENKLM